MGDNYFCDKIPSTSEHFVPYNNFIRFCELVTYKLPWNQNMFAMQQYD